MIELGEFGMKKSFRILTAILATFLLSACGLGDRYIRGLLTEQNPELPIFMDDFSDHDNGWLLTVTDQGVAHYDGDAIRILINEFECHLLDLSWAETKRFDRGRGCGQSHRTG